MRLVTLAIVSLLLPTVALAADLPSGHPPVTPGQQTPAPAAEELPIHSGTVIEAIPANTYVYVHAKTTTGDEWLAGPAIELKPGATVKWNEGHIMNGFSSPSLKRTFESIRFVEVLKAGD